MAEFERLTKHLFPPTTRNNGIGCTHFDGRDCVEREGQCTDDCPWEEAAWARLAAYEDSGLSPERVAELAKAEAESKLLILPIGMTIGCMCPDDIWLERDGVRYLADHWNIRLSAFADNQPTPSGTKVALMGIEEAQAALERMRAMNDIERAITFFEDILKTRAKPDGEYGIEQDDVSQIQTALVALREKYDARMWVSVKDRLPKEAGEYLVNVHQETEDGDFGDAVLNAWYAPVELPFVPKDIGWTLLNEFYDLSSQMKDDITHWMPLPEPPKEVEHG